MIPKVIKQYNIFFQDNGYSGICTEVELPELTIKEEGFRGGGMDAEFPLDMGMETPEIGFTMEEHVKEVMRKFGRRDVMGRFSAGKSDDRTTERYTIRFKGSFGSMPLGNVVPGEKSPMKGKIKCVFLEILQGDEELVYIDIENRIRRIGGFDFLAEMRDATS